MIGAKKDRIRVIGLTGGIAAGKTTVSQMLREKGAWLIDADSVGHQVIAPDGEAFAEVVRAFGEGILDEKGAIDRKKLGAVVFADPDNLKKLNAISHPLMARRMATEIEAVQDRRHEEKTPLILLDAAILFEARWDILCDEAWVVVAEPEVTIPRLMERNKFSREEAQARLNAQIGNQERILRAKRVIHNDGNLETLRARVDEIWREVTERESADPEKP